MRAIRLLSLLFFCAAAYAFPGPSRAEPVAASALAAQTSVSNGLVQNAYWYRYYGHRHYYRPYYHHYYYRPYYHRYYYHHYYRPHYHHYYYRPYYHHYGWRRHYWHRRYW